MKLYIKIPHYLILVILQFEGALPGMSQEPLLHLLLLCKGGKASHYKQHAHNCSYKTTSRETHLLVVCSNAN